MKKRLWTLLCVLLAAAILLPGVPVMAETTLWDGSTAIAFGGGLGTEERPYLIQDGRQLAYLAKRVNDGEPYSGRYFLLTGDIDLNGNLWTPIGSYGEEAGFGGIFYGDGHVIQGLVTDSDLDGQGLFGYISGGAVSGLTVSDSAVEGRDQTGALAGVLAGTLDACGSTAAVAGRNVAGGLAGEVLSGGTLLRCWFGGEVAAGEYTGGLAGRVAAGGQVKDCYSTGAVTGSAYVGGGVGYLSGSLTSSYSAGTFDGQADTGGLAGGADGEVTAGFYLSGQGPQRNSVGRSVSASGLGGESVLYQLNTVGETVSQRRQWLINSAQNGGYPVLDWQYIDVDGWLNPYGDVSVSDWYYEAVKDVTRLGLFTGTGEGSFSPDGQMSRAMFVTALGKLAEQMDISVTGPASGFADVEPGSWYETYVDWAASEGLVQGYTDTAFGVDDSVTREQIAVLLVRFAQRYTVALPGDGAADFTDSREISDWAVGPVNEAAAAGLITGYPDGSFDPLGSASRAEAATLFQRFSALCLMEPE